VALTKFNGHLNIDRELRKAVAWAVHAFTACGIIAGFLALVAVLKGDAVAAFLWLGLALFVDGIDGSLARKARVLEYLPNFDGRTLDNVIDFFNYVAVPALMVYWFGMVPGTWGLVAAATIMAVSLYTFANVGVKSEDYYFVGFPSIWNVVVLYFYILETGWVVNLVTIAALSILTFVPIKFVHPLRVTDWREITVPVTVLWAAMTLSLVISDKDQGPKDLVYQIELWAWIVSSLYFAGISLWRTFMKRMPHPAEDDSHSHMA
jgi:phosphatidylcholine synthase